MCAGVHSSVRTVFGVWPLSSGAQIDCCNSNRWPREAFNGAYSATPPESESEYLSWWAELGPNCRCGIVQAVAAGVIGEHRTRQPKSGAVKNRLRPCSRNHRIDHRLEDWQPR